MSTVLAGPGVLQTRKWGKALKICMVIGLLLGLALLLCACDYPGQDPPCVGANKNAEGCADPVQKVVDDPNGGPWYVSWALDIVRSMLTSVSINSVRLGVSVFWQIFTNLSSTDFAACGTGGSGSPTCTVVNVFTMVNTIAIIFLPVILSYKIFKSYFLGGLIEPLHEGFLSFFPKILIGGFAMYFLAVIFSGGFGISNILFDTIIGGAASLADISKNLLGDCPSASVCGSGIGSVGDVKNIGLLLFMTVVCLAASLVFIVLGLVFFLRTIIIFILFAISPLAVVAGLTEEFKPWFSRWLSSVQAMLIAPIPVAICFALVKAFTSAIPSANGDPAGFILQLVYIISFLTIGAILMFKIAGSVGGLAFGMAAAGLGALTQGAVGFALGKDSETTQTSGPGSNGGKSGRSGNTQPGNTSASQDPGSGAGSPSTSVNLSGGAGVGIGVAPALATAGAEQQQRQLMAALRSLNENLSSTTIQRSVTTTNNSGDKRFYQARTAGFNMQNAFLWTGSELGLSAPYFQFSPPANNTRSVSTTNSVIEQKANKTYSVPANDPLEEGSTGPVQNSQGVQPQAQLPPHYAAPQVQVPQPGQGVVRPGSPAPTPVPAPVSHPVTDPATVQAPPRRLKVNGVIPNPYTHARSADPFITGKASELTE